MNTLQRILYVEDDPDIQAIAQWVLEDMGGFNVRICSSGEEALTVAPVFVPHLILLDVMMPGMDGLATFRALRTLPGLQGVPVVFMTARVQSHEVDDYRQQGATGVISKPFDPMTLADQVRMLWKEHCHV